MRDEERDEAAEGDGEDQPLMSFASPRARRQLAESRALDITPTRTSPVPEVRDSLVVDSSGAIRAHRSLSFSSPVLGHLDAATGLATLGSDLVPGLMRHLQGDGASPSQASASTTLPGGDALVAGSTGLSGLFGPLKGGRRALTMGGGGQCELTGTEFLFGDAGGDISSPRTVRLARPDELVDVSGDGTPLSPEDL